ncbi:4'-phosphopantetheinyl transferase family protein [Hymenobacter setariae]|uniref:4'-phosphopantetheinyl transferase family protein n=1 Tax=Hymenobacter setariae TaxID=2594794 RepID=UPI001F274E1E|nr:4'-phosphopantetheinyl transferase superfamily protein [Hymenobacter setariae]
MHLGKPELDATPPGELPVLLTCNTRPGAERWQRPAFGAPTGVTIFRLHVTGSLAFVSQAAALLQAEEQRRAQRYHRAEDYHRFVLGRAAQRLVLGAYLGLPPAGLHFEPGAAKKPRLREAPGLHYNVSHAGDWVLLAVAKAEVGIDIERLAPQFAFQEVLDYSFSPAEKAFIERSLVPTHAFYQLWTRKEAFVKATGRGIDAEFAQVPALDGQHHVASPGQVPRWVVSTFEAAAGYVAAVAYPAALPGPQQFYELGNDVLDELYTVAPSEPYVLR